MQTNYIILIIVGTGIFGGLINYFRNEYDKQFVFIDTFKSILLGLAASALVPLFLNTISSDLLLSDVNVETNYFLFLGFCLIASMFSGEFIDSIGKKVLNEINKVKKELEDSNTESDSEDIEEAYNTSDLSENQKKVLEAFLKSRFTYRSITGISKESSLDKTVVKQTLIELQNRGLIEVVQRKKGSRWKVTSEGYMK